MSNEEISHFLNVDLIDVENARDMLLTLEPLGIGARNLQESLLIQAQAKYKDDTLLFTVIEHHLEDLANRNWKVIAERLHISRQQVIDIFQKIKTLQPKPAMNFTTKGAHYVTPDIIVETNKDNDSFTITLNQHYIPQIRFNQDYVYKVKHHQEVKPYVDEQFKRFNWLQRSIEQRRDTILKIMEVVLTKQKAFFKEGFRVLKPLTLRDVAEEIGMHESTVSRATANKIVETPNGTFELRRLFSTSVATSTGSGPAQTKVKEILKEIIDSEDKASPLSDQKIVDTLRAQYQIKISRRTVAKYRDELNIPSSTRRKELM